MAKLCIALGLCAAAAFFSLSQFTSRQRRDDDVKALCSWITRAGVPARVRHWALTSPILQCAENLQEEHEEGVKTLASSFATEEEDVLTTPVSVLTESPYESSHQEYDDLTPKYRTEDSDHLEEYQTGWDRKTASPESRTSAQLEHGTLQLSLSRILAPSPEPQRATYRSRSGETPEGNEMVITLEPLSRANQDGDMHVAKKPETEPPSSSDQLVKGTTTQFFITNLETFDTTSIKTEPKPPLELTGQRENQLTSTSLSPTLADNGVGRHTTNPAILASIRATKNPEETTTYSVLPGILERKSNEVPAKSAVLVSTTHRREKQEASESSSTLSSTTIHVHPTETIYFGATYTSEPQKEVAGMSEALPHIEERGSEPTPIASLPPSPFPASKEEEEMIPINFSNADLGSDRQQAETTSSNIRYLLGKDTHEGTSTSTPVHSITREIKQSTTIKTPSELDLTSPNQEDSTAGLHSAPYTDGSEQDIDTWTTLVKSNVDSRGEASESTRSELITEQRSEKALNSVLLPESSTLWLDKDITAKTTTHSAVGGTVKTTKSSKSDLLLRQRVEKTFTSAPLSESSGSLRQLQDTMPTTTEVQPTVELRAQETTSTKLDLNQPQAETLISSRLPEPSVSWQDLDTLSRTIIAQADVENSAGATASTELNLQPEQQVRKKLPSAPEPESTSSWQDQNVTRRTTAAQSTIEDHAETTTSTTSSVESEPRVEKTFNSTQLSESSTSWEDQDTTPTSIEVQTAVQDDVEAATTAELDIRSDQQEEKKSPSAQDSESTTSWKNQDVAPGTPAVQSTHEDHVQTTTSTKSAIESKQLVEKPFNSTRLSESSTSWQDGNSTLTSTETQTPVQDGVETATSSELDKQSDQQEQKKSPSTPGPELSTSWKLQDITPSTAPAHFTVEEHVEATASTISELEPEQAEKTVSSEPLSETSNSWQDEDAGRRTPAAQSTAEHTVETTTTTRSDFLSEQRSENTLTSVQLTDSSTSHQDPYSMGSTTVAPLRVKDRVEVAVTNEPLIEEPKGPKIVCYFTSWSIYRDDRGRFNPEDVNPKLCTHIIYAFSTLDPATLQISMADPLADEDMELYKRVTALKTANRQLKILLSLGGAADSEGLDQKYSRLAANATARRNFARHAASFLVEHRFDGLDVDWEFPNCDLGVCPSNPRDKENFVLLLENLREDFHEYSPPLLLTAAVSGDIETIEEAYLVPKIFKHLDFASIMAYDYYGDWSTVVGHYAPLQSAMDEMDPEKSIEYVVHALLAMGAPASQLVLGVPFYARSFTLANPRLNYIGSPSKGAGKPGNVTHSPGVLSYYEICSTIKAGGWSTMMDTRAGVYAYSGDQWVCFDGPRSVTRKARFAQRVGLAGLMVWDLSMDDFRGECGRVRPLLSAAHRALYPPPVAPAGSG